MKTSRKPLTTLTLGQKDLSRRAIFCAEQDALKALQTKNLGRPTSQREIIMAKEDAVKVLKAKEFDRAVLEAQENETRAYLDGKALKAKGLRVGNRVQYSREWLVNTGQNKHERAFWKGTIIGRNPFGYKDLAVCTVDFYNGDTVNVLNVNLELV